MIISNKITITPDDGSYGAIKAYCKRELISDNPEYANAERMGFYTGKIPKKIYHYEMDSDNIILPFGIIDVLKLNGWLGSYSLDVGTLPDIDGWNYDLGLYDYQDECVEAMIKAKHGIFTAPTGSGKTQTFIGLILRRKKKALVIVNTVELLKQAKDRIESLTEIECGTITGGKIDIKDITIATVQTLANIDLVQYQYTWGTVIMDELQYLCGSPAKMAMFFKVFNSLKTLGKYGCTALLHRADGLEKVAKFCIGDIKHQVPRDIVSDKIMKAEVVKVNLSTEKSFEYLKSDGTLDYCKLQNYLADNEYRNASIAEMIKNDVCMDHSCIVLCDRIAQVENIYNMLDPEYAVMVTGSMTSKNGKAEREAAVIDMRNGNKRCLIATVSLAGTGLDIPCLNRLYHVSIQKDLGKTIQAAGRILRTCNDKESPVIYDFCDINISYCVGAHKKRIRYYKTIECEVAK